MSTLETNTITMLNRLIETLRDGEQGFEAAADRVQEPQLRMVLSEYAAQRSGYTQELQDLARSFGEREPEDSGSISGAMHRGWIDFKSLFTGKDEKSILTECERGEESAIEAFREALDHNEMAVHVREVLLRQLGGIRSALDRIHTMREMHS